MKQFIPKPQDFTIFAQVVEGQTLMDKRRGKRGLVLGDITDVARQYGVKSVKKDDGFMFVASKSKMQLFVGVLHFAEIPYWEV